MASLPYVICQTDLSYISACASPPEADPAEAFARVCIASKGPPGEITVRSGTVSYTATESDKHIAGPLF